MKTTKKPKPSIIDALRKYRLQLARARKSEKSNAGIRQPEPRAEEAKKLLLAAKRKLPELNMLLFVTLDYDNCEDRIYRFYHQSFKVYGLQATTLEIVSKLQSLAPHLKLDPFFLEIVAEGTGKQFDLSHNADWFKQTRPIVEAFFHAHHMLLMVCKYAEELSEPPIMMPSGWATVLCLYNLR